MKPETFMKAILVFTCAFSLFAGIGNAVQFVNDATFFKGFMATFFLAGFIVNLKTYLNAE